MSKVVYDPGYNISFLGLEKLHPFDSRKYGRAWQCLREQLGDALDAYWVKPDSPVCQADLERVHSADYLQQLRNLRTVAGALEISAVAAVPRPVVDRCVLRPMRWATAGTIAAAQAAMRDGLAINLGGGFHHAKPDSGEGFCIYADAAIAVARLRADAALASDDAIAYIDLDAHQGNGVCHSFLHDPSCRIFDMYNGDIYPTSDHVAHERIDCDLPLSCGATDALYLDTLKAELPTFLDGFTPRLAIYNAGTDIFADDPLGAMGVSAEAILERDLFTVCELRKREIPTVMVLSGGYTRESYRLVADSVARLLTDPLQGSQPG